MKSMIHGTQYAAAIGACEKGGRPMGLREFTIVNRAIPSVALPVSPLGAD